MFLLLEHFRLSDSINGISPFAEEGVLGTYRAEMGKIVI